MFLLDAELLSSFGTWEKLLQDAQDRKLVVSSSDFDDWTMTQNLNATMKNLKI